MYLWLCTSLQTISIGKIDGFWVDRGTGNTKSLPGFSFTPSSGHPQHEITTNAFAIILQFLGICDNFSTMAIGASGILL